jgi:RecB family exonuclease
MSDPLILRPSSLTTYADCPRRWAAKHMADEVRAAGYALTRPPLPTHVGAAVGTAVHTAVSVSLKPRIEGSEALAPRDVAEDAAIEALRGETEHGVAWDEATPDMNTAEKQVVRMSRAWRASPAADVVPLAVETRLEVVITDGIHLSGQADTVTRSPDMAIRDLKTGTRRRANGLQYGAYAMVWRGHGIPVTRLVEDYLRRAPLREEQLPPVEIEVGLRTAMNDAWETLQAIARDVREFRNRAGDPDGRPPNGAFRPNPGSSLCGERFCPAWGTDFCRSHA